MKDKLSIPGVDLKTGLANVGGSREIFRELLAQLVEDMEARLPVLSTLPQGEEELKLFATAAHGVKSGCANIGAEEMRARALEMEMAGKEGDTQGISRKLEGFSGDLKILIGDIKKALEEDLPE